MCSLAERRTLDETGFLEHATARNVPERRFVQSVGKEGVMRAVAPLHVRRYHSPVLLAYDLEATGAILRISPVMAC